MKNRVCALYRVSTDKQVDHNDKNQADIPMQRKACHAFCDKMGWTIVHEEQEEGVSGHKVRAENRDKLQIIKGLAKQKKFDILLVFMFDRIGRIADETPFVVEWFVKQGIGGSAALRQSHRQAHQLHPLLAGRRRERKDFHPHQDRPGAARRGGRLQGRACPLWL